MAKAPNRQVTPAISRIWVYGILATTIACALNAGWLYLCNNVTHWSLQVPQELDPKTLVAASTWRIVLATAIAGAASILVSLALSKLVIGPRIWWMILGFGVGFASLYGALTLPNVDTWLRVRLSVMHIIAIVIIVPTLAKALGIKDVDHEAADRRYHEQLDAIKAQEAAAALATQAQQNPTQAPLNPTIAVPVLDVNALVGKTEDQATADIESASHEFRVVSRDGQQFPTSRDYRGERVNLTIDNGVVTAATIG